MRIVHAARERLASDLADPEAIWAGWKKLFESVCATGQQGKKKAA